MHATPATQFFFDLVHSSRTFLFVLRQGLMVVKTQCKGREFTGVEVGAGNVRRYFPRDAHVIELHLDHLLIQCGLKPDFWQGQAQIRDPRLCAWLESKNFRARPGEAPVPLALIPSGKNSYRLQPICPHARPRTKPANTPFHPA